MRTPCVRHCRAGQPWLFRLLGKIDLLESYAASSRCSFGLLKHLRMAWQVVKC